MISSPAAPTLPLCQSRADAVSTLPARALPSRSPAPRRDVTVTRNSATSGKRRITASIAVGKTLFRGR
jgi:hypothetical protein